jgi:hypothetical protein
MFQDNLVLGAAGTALGLGVDLHTVGNDPSKGEPVPLEATMTELGAGGTNLIASLVQADDAALSANLEALVVGPTILTAALLVGVKLLPSTPFLPLELITRRFIGVRIVTTGTHTGGIVNSSLVWNRQTADSAFTAVTGF